MARSSSGSKLLLVLWKNVLLTSKLSLLLEYSALFVCMFLIVYFRKIEEIKHTPMTLYPSLKINNLELFKKSLDNSSTSGVPRFELFYSPPNKYLEEIVKDAVNTLSLSDFTAYPNAAALENALIAGNILAGVQFDDSYANLTSYPSTFSFALRFPGILRTSKKNQTWMTTDLFVDSTSNEVRNIEDDDGGEPIGYLKEGFLPVQTALSIAYLKLAGNVNSLPNVEMQRYPNGKNIIDKFWLKTIFFTSLLLVLGFYYPCLLLVQNIVTEKEKQLKEVMKIMGLDNWIHWTAWFTRTVLQLITMVIVAVIILKIQWSNDTAVLNHSSWSATLCFLIIFIISFTCFSLMMATFFSKVNIADLVFGNALAFIILLSIIIVVETYEKMSLSAKLGWCTLFTSAFAIGVKLIGGSEIKGEGLQWNNIFQPVFIDDDITIGAVMLMLTIFSIIYIIIGLYIEKVLPGDFGTTEKWYFPFTAAFWSRKKKYKYTGVKDKPDHLNDSSAFESEPSDKRIGVQVLNLKRMFGNKIAVNGLSMNMYEDEITVLLGHNGAGKTTTISMLTGIIPPTSGTAIINGSDIRTDIVGARMSMGICPQHNVLFDSLSVKNHLVFFSRLKGLEGNAVKKEVDKFLKKIKLEDKAEVASKNLSGGMKRKLSICCALCGDAKVVFCDEPSSGMDPAARRQLWDLLQNEKNGRTILLTTHYMDEADALGDRIAIMCGGELKCYGTSFFLKKKYGSGYHLVCVKREGCNVAEVTAFLGNYIPNINAESDIGTELSYRLPENYASEFERMFRDLASNSDQLNLNGYGVGITSMEEVFMKVGAESGSGLAEPDFETKQYDHIFSGIAIQHNSTNLRRSQWLAMILKISLYTMRNIKVLLILVLLTILLVNLPFITNRMKLSGYSKALQPITFSLTQYPMAVTILETTIDVESNSLEAKIANEYKSIANSYSKKYTLKSTEEKSFSDYILELGQTIQEFINSRYLAAATITKGKITAWLNNQPLHTAPLTVNMVYNAMAKVIVGQNAEIIVTNAPLPFDIQSQLKDIETSMFGIILIMNLNFALAMVSSFYIIFIIRERVSRSKLLQLVDGVRVHTFWFTHFLWDLTTFVIIILIIIIIMACYQENGFSTYEELGHYFLVFLIFGCAMLPLIYLFSYLFTDSAKGFTIATVLCLYTGFSFITQLIPTLKKLATFLKIFPHNAVLSSVFKIYTNSLTRTACANDLYAILPDALRCQLFPECCTTTPFLAWDDPGILMEIVFMVITGVGIFFIIISIDIGLLQRPFHYIFNKIVFSLVKPKKRPNEGNVEEDVLREKELILAMSKDTISRQNLVLDRVSKIYGNFKAVNEVSLCVKRAECFGLLGVNGAGKTTIFKIMTGEIVMTSGSAYIKGMNIKSEMSEINKHIGYCPQFDALLEDLTGRETLKIFCLIRGIKRSRIKFISEELAKTFGFLKHIDKKIKEFSGGNKRKLSSAIAVIGNITVLFMDEPTAGMDPAARRHLWNMVSNIRDSGISIVLTTHSMEECEALCTRLAIMVNGELKCIGSTQHLKNTFSKGLILKIKIRQNKDKPRHGSTSNSNLNDDAPTIDIKDQYIQTVKEFVERELEQAVLKEEFQGILTFYIPLSSIEWSEIFGLIQRNRENLNIEDYYISQTSLEEIFLEFAKHQHEPDTTI